MSKLTLELVSRKFPEVRESYGKNGEEFNVHCPFFHEKGGQYKFYINAETGTYYCQDCQKAGDAWFDFFDSIVSAKYGKLKILKDSQDSRVRFEKGKFNRPFYAGKGKSIRWGVRNIIAPGHTVSLGDLPPDHPACEYMEFERGMKPEEFRDKEHPFHVLYCTKGQVEVLKGRCKAEARIICPIYQSNEVVGWTARRIEKTEGEGESQRKFNWTGKEWIEIERGPGEKWEDSDVPKWFHLPTMSKSQVLYNFDIARAYDTVVLCEGPFDVMRVGEFAVGYLGDTPSEAQIRMVKNEWERVFWIPDSNVDRNSKKFLNALASISEGCDLKVLDLPEGKKDPGDTSREALAEIIRKNL